MNLELITRQNEEITHATPLLFVHGAWHSAWCWDVHFMPYFAAQGYNCHAVSLRGHGASEGNLRSARIKDYVADVRSIVDKLPNPPVLIGHSMGGLVIQKMLEEVDLPAAVLLASIPTSGATRFFFQMMFRYPGATLRCLLTLDTYKLIENPETVQNLFFSDDLPSEQMNAYHAHIQAESIAVLADITGLALPRPSRVDTPLLVIGAADDRVFTVGEVQRTAQAYGTEATIVPNTAHDIMLEPNWKITADHILEWLDKRGL